MKIGQTRPSISQITKAIPRFDKLFCREANHRHFDCTDIHWILENEAWYADGPPRWKKAPVATDAYQEWAAAVEALGSQKKKSLLNLQARDALKRCRPSKRCMSGACYSCSRAIQRWSIVAIKHLSKIKLPNHEVRAFNYVFPAGQADRGKLKTVKFQELMDGLISLIEVSCAVRYGVLAFDISLNDDTAKFQAGKYVEPPVAYWQVHIYGVIWTTDYKKVARVIKDATPHDEKIWAPIKAKKKYDGSNKAISYLFKPTAFRRSSFWSTKGKRPSWKTKQYRLAKDDQVEFLSVMNVLGIHRRIGLINLHPLKTPAGKRSPRGILLRPVIPRRVNM